MRRIDAEPITAAAFAPFGSLIDAASSPAETINDGTTRRHSDLARLDVAARGDPVLGVYVAQARATPLRIAKLECHREAAQVFLPLGSHPFIVIVAAGIEQPEWDRLRAFRTSAGQGVALRRGCWHHGLVALANGDRFAVIEGASYRDDTLEAAAPGGFELAF